MASKEDKLLKPELLNLKRSSALRTAHLMTAALASGDLTRSKDVPEISRPIRPIGQ
ncbi:hypothetical protein [Pseudoduganella aquatica]|uniref:Uncharacterized protein n=1 Tax=Pseudoduganella aquatica TaxID=2660641 RepID=A0A7X4HB05_9BURK|nr:hypothetical protein [Pseudoduganella aquatica]MYN07934.1 hypothetical protein [Pseudoduganella aquatica]